MIPRRAEEVLPVDFDMALFGRCQRLRTAPKNAQKCALSPFNGRGNPRGRRDPQERAEKLPLIHFVNLANKASELKRKPVIQGAQASDE